MRHFKNFNFIDKCMLYTYIFIIISTCLFFYFLIFDVLNGDLHLRAVDILLIIFLPTALVIGVSSLFGCWLTAYLYRKSREIHDAYSIESYSRINAGGCLLTSSILLFVLAGFFFEGFGFGWIGTAAFFISAIPMMVYLLEKKLW